MPKLPPCDQYGREHRRYHPYVAGVIAREPREGTAAAYIVHHGDVFLDARGDLVALPVQMDYLAAVLAIQVHEGRAAPPEGEG